MYCAVLFYTLRFFSHFQTVFSAQIDDWMYWSTLTSDDEKVWIERLTALNQHLALRTYIVGHTLSLADAAAFHSVEQSTVARAIFESKKGKSFGHVKVKIVFNFHKCLD